MLFHKLRPDGSLDESRNAEYLEHLDAISARLPGDLYLILRDPKDAYLKNCTFYDSTIVRWHEDMRLPSFERILAVTAIEAWKKWKFNFEFQDGLEVTQTRAHAGMMLGRLYFLEVAQASEGRIAFSFIDSLREETVVVCRAFEFRRESIS